jgi:exodeoxyribonuclease V alpha subunit
MELIEHAINQALRRGHLVQDELNHEPCVYLEALYRAELNSARHLKRLNQGSPPWGKLDVNACVEWVETQGNVVYSASQRQALHALLQAKCAIITGGPGVGKTTMISSVLMIAQSNQLQVALCAPTGRAAKRLSDTTHWPAKTLHRLLQYEADSAVFKHNQANLLPVDVVIVDEASMVDVVLMDHFLAAVPSHAAVIWVGDCDQLPSVGSGAVLADLIASGVITTVRLAEIFRQSARSAIITNAYRVNQGELPLPNAGKNSDFFTIYAQTPEEIYHRLLEVVCQRLPRIYACDPMKDIQVLTPMNRGTLGSRAINLALQRQLNGNETVNVSRLGTTFLRGDKIIQLTNNYEKEVFNGDMGIIHHIDAATGHVIIQFDQTLKEYTYHELGEISLAYAISVHKSQGSEFPVVVIPLATQHYMLLARNVLYTGMTRGKQCVVLIGQKKAVEKAVSNDKASRRYTNLAARLRDLSDHVV